MGRVKKQRREPSTLHDHVKELLMRLLSVLISILIVGVIIYFSYEPVLIFLSSPLKDTLYYNTPAGGFTFVMKICFTGGFIISIPVIIYNIVMFIRPVFKTKLALKKVFSTTAISTALALLGASFAFFIVVPGSISFFSGYQIENLNSLITADSYLNFITGIMIMFALIFQLPLIVLFIDYIKPLETLKLLKASKYVIVGSLIITTLQPFSYDTFTDMSIALSIIIVYYISVLSVFIHHKQLRNKRIKNNAVIVKPIKSTELHVSDMILNNLKQELPSKTTTEKKIYSASEANDKLRVEFADTKTLKKNLDFQPVITNNIAPIQKKSKTVIDSKAIAKDTYMDIKICQIQRPKNRQELAYISRENTTIRVIERKKRIVFSDVVKTTRASAV